MLVIIGCDGEDVLVLEFTIQGDVNDQIELAVRVVGEIERLIDERLIVVLEQLNGRDDHAVLVDVGELVVLHAVLVAVDVLGLGETNLHAGHVVLGERDRVGVGAERRLIVVDVLDGESQEENVVVEHVVEFHRDVTFRAELVVRTEDVAIDALADGDEIARRVEDEQGRALEQLIGDQRRGETGEVEDDRADGRFFVERDFMFASFSRSDEKNENEAESEHDHLEMTGE